MEQEFVIFAPQKNAYVTVDRLANASLTTEEAKARRFSQKAAKNFIQNNMKKFSGAFTIKQIEMKRPSSYKGQPNLATRACNGIYTESDLKAILDRLNNSLSNFDMQLSDLYHFAGDNPRLPANKGYKLYRKLVDIVQKRAEIKLQIIAIQEALAKERQPYRPRTDVYGELESM